MPWQHWIIVLHALFTIFIAMTDDTGYLDESDRVTGVAVGGLVLLFLLWGNA